MNSIPRDGALVAQLSIKAVAGLIPGWAAIKLLGHLSLPSLWGR